MDGNRLGVSRLRHGSMAGGRRKIAFSRTDRRLRLGAGRRNAEFTCRGEEGASCRLGRWRGTVSRHAFRPDSRSWAIARGRTCAGCAHRCGGRFRSGGGTVYRNIRFGRRSRDRFGSDHRCRFRNGFRRRNRCRDRFRGRFRLRRRSRLGLRRRGCRLWSRGIAHGGLIIILVAGSGHNCGLHRGGRSRYGSHGGSRCSCTALNAEAVAVRDLAAAVVTKHSNRLLYAGGIGGSLL